MKAVAGKLLLHLPPIGLERKALGEGFTVLPLTVEHVDRFHQLPTVRRDPFDRLLAAIALAGDYIVLSPDSAFDNLGVKRVW